MPTGKSSLGFTGGHSAISLEAHLIKAIISTGELRAVYMHPSGIRIATRTLESAAVKYLLGLMSTFSITEKSLSCAISSWGASFGKQ